MPVGPPSTCTVRSCLRPLAEYGVLDSRASFAVHHGPVGLAASPHAFTSCRSECAPCPARSETSADSMYASGRADDRSTIVAARIAATASAATMLLRAARVTRRRGRRAYDERRRELHSQCLDALSFEEPHQEADAGSPQLLQRLAHGRELRPHDARLERVVEADDREVVGDPQAELPCGIERAD